MNAGYVQLYSLFAPALIYSAAKQMNSPLDGLNPDQARAVTSTAKHLLVLAGAGSGKTFVITRRILHLVASGIVRPEQVLAITFTRNAAREMARRLGESPEKSPSGPRYNVRTFHSLCYLILRKHWRLILERPFRLVTDSAAGSQKTSPELRGVSTKSELLLETIRSLFAEPDFRIAFKRYLWDYQISAEESDRFGGGYDPRPQRYLTLAGERVRSYAERDIANWLHENGISYLYRKPALWSSPSFSPDFHLPATDTYLEVWEFGRGNPIERQNRLAQYRAKDKRLIEVYRDELLDFPAVEKRLAGALPEIFPRGAASLSAGDLDCLESSAAGYPEAIKSFLALAEEILDRMKNHSIGPRQIEERLKKEKYARSRSFYALFLRIHERYQELLISEGALDFNELILKTVELFETHPDLRERYRAHWRQVLVDEYQDVNTPQVMLLRQLAGPENSLTCVGDDWQSIYGFRGSDVTHILEFEKAFRPCEVVPLRVNYRNSTPVVALANLSVRKCHSFRDKPSIALKEGGRPIVLFRARHLYEDGVGYVAARVRELTEEDGFDPAEVLILYRRNSSFRLLGEVLREAGLKVRHETIHAAKGLEARAVFLWALTGGRGGFPSIWDESRIVRLLLPGNRNRRLDEERRIFYVALTRALERLYLVSEQHNPSPFLENVPGEYFAGSAPRAPGPQARETRPCRRCGASLPGDYRFCPYCFEGLERLK